MIDQRRNRAQSNANIHMITNCDGVNQMNNSNSKNQTTFAYRYEENLIPTLPNAYQIKRISIHTMHELLCGKYHRVQSFEIYDCRYKYEYEGGHIKGAKNLNSLEEIEQIFFSQPKFSPNSVYIFHCEFSANRGPSCAEFLRNTDRQLNLNKYPFVYYPNVYILDGGYSSFYKQYSCDCDGGYTPMLDSAHCKNEDLKISTSEHRKNFKLSKNNRTSSLSSISSSLFILLPKGNINSPLSATLPIPSPFSESLESIENNSEKDRKLGKTLHFDLSDSSDDENDKEFRSFDDEINNEDDIDDNIQFDVEVDPFD